MFRYLNVFWKEKSTRKSTVSKVKNEINSNKLKKTAQIPWTPYLLLNKLKQFSIWNPAVCSLCVHQGAVKGFPPELAAEVVTLSVTQIRLLPVVMLLLTVVSAGAELVGCYRAYSTPQVITKIVRLFFHWYVAHAHALTPQGKPSSII